MAIFQGNIYSDSLGMSTQIYAYLPQDEPAKITKERPKTLILLHGLMGNAGSWPRRTNLDGLAEKYNIAIFMPEVQRSFYTDLNPGLKYFTYVSTELPELIGRMFQVSVDYGNLWIAGLSMGGYGAMKCALSFPERFSKIGAFSAMYRMEDYISRFKQDESNPAIQRSMEDFYLLYGKDLDGVEEGNLHRKFQENHSKKLPQMYLSCGLQDGLLPMSREFHALLENNNHPHIYEEWQGAHEWNFWAESLKRMLEVFHSQ